MDENAINCEINNDVLLNQLKYYILEMEKNTKIFDRLNKKFIIYQQE